MAQTCCFMGVGVLSMAKSSDFLAKKVGLVKVGNVTQADFNMTTTKKGNIKNRQTIGGGDECSKQHIDEATLTLKMSCFKDINIVNALFGDLVSQTAQAVVSEQHVAYKGTVVGLKKYPAAQSNLVVKGTGADAVVTYTIGVDYLINDFGNAIEILETGSIPAPVEALGVPQENITIEYASKNASLIGIASEISVPFFIEINGGNILAENEDDLAYTTRFFKASLSPAQVISFIADSDDASQMELKATLLQDQNFKAIYGSKSGYGTWLKAA
jgi:hypothetical protein